MNSNINRKTQFIDLGLKEYAEAWDYQTKLFEQILEIKKKNRDLPESEQAPTSNFLIFCEHPHVYTLGKSGDEKNLLIPKEKLNTINATYFHINRGGDITYHGPGQIVVYPVIDMENFFTDIHKYMRLLEEAVILTLKEFGIAAGRIKGLTGAWLDPDDTEKNRKICALGVKTSRWVTLHGLAFNVNTNLDYFKHIIPCGIEDKAVTSIATELGVTQDLNRVKKSLLNNIVSLFEMEIVN
ncbi:MAG TPA: lipoyl(octanoyl) transferase LipB [Cyclobacteriaceae bacterium]|nr:lipoyl(octanoyl) transferase LipB [Cyclobacteriaceae bacterium]HNP07395.1 lipoyl(octanoyl) transferase LipB [Cyclobacteriaceae bacterium]